MFAYTVCLLTNERQDHARYEPLNQSYLSQVLHIIRTLCKHPANKLFEKPVSRRAPYMFTSTHMYIQRVSESVYIFIFIHSVFMCLLYVCCYMSLLGWFAVSHPQFRSSLLDGSWFIQGFFSREIGII